MRQLNKTLQRIVYISHLCSSYPDIHDRVWCTWRKINVFMCNMYTYEDYIDMVMHIDIHMWKDFAYFVSFWPFSLSQKKNIKISLRGRGQSVFEKMSAIIHCKIYYLLWTKKMQSFFIRISKLWLRLIVLKFSSFFEA